MKVVIWFSCGAASAVAAKLAVERYGNESCRVVNNPIAEEDEDNQRFLVDVEKWIGITIEKAINPEYQSTSAVEVWNRRKFMSGIGGAPCTLELKRKARQHWESQNEFDFLVLGFTSEEKDRAERFQKTERRNLVPILIEEGFTKRDCFLAVSEAGLTLPRVYQMGYPNANCIGCVKATSPTYWNLVRRNHPGVFAERAKQSRELGVKLARHKGSRIFLDELPEDARGNSIKTMSTECGLFCEEYTGKAINEQ